ICRLDSSVGFSTSTPRIENSWSRRSSASHTTNGVLSHGGGELLEQVARQRMLQTPGYGHGRFGLVLHVRGRTEEPERAVVRAQTGKEQDRISHTDVVAVTKAGLAVFPCRRLALPVHQLPADRVIMVPRR